MKIKSLSLAFLVTLGTSSVSSASVVDTFSVLPGAINAGDSATLSLSLSMAADAGYFNPFLFGGTVTFNFGDGGTATFAIAPGNFQQFSQSHTYATPGSYTASYSFSANYYEQYQSWDYLYSLPYQQIVGYRYYSCGFGGLSTCSDPIYQTAYQAVYGWQTHTVTLGDAGAGSASLSVTDRQTASPVAGPVVGAGFPGVVMALAGLLVWRRRRDRAA